MIKLRRCPADSVAGTIRLMMGGKEEKKDQSSNQYYGYYNPYRNREKQEDSSDKFHVEADVEFNRLLLKANDIELKEIENLLIKLGEIPSRGTNSSTVRVIDVEPGEDSEKLLKRLRRIWPSLGPNELLLDPSTESKEKEKEEKRTQDKKPQAKPNLLKSTQSIPQDNPESRVVIPVALNDGSGKNIEVAQKDSAETPQQSQPPIVNEQGNLINPNFRNPNLLRKRRQTPGMTPPPISITRTPDGRLMISSQDTRALDSLEEVMTRMIPPRKDYKIFLVKYADAYWVMKTSKSISRRMTKIRVRIISDPGTGVMVLLQTIRALPIGCPGENR